MLGKWKAFAICFNSLCEIRQGGQRKDGGQKLVSILFVRFLLHTSSARARADGGNNCDTFGRRRRDRVLRVREKQIRKNQHRDIERRLKNDGRPDR